MARSDFPLRAFSLAHLCLPNVYHGHFLTDKRPQNSHILYDFLTSEPLQGSSYASDFPILPDIGGIWQSELQILEGGKSKIGNLKRALSLVLAVVMVIGLMVVGASAVSYNDFSDHGEIVNKDAVSMLTTLGIIEGKPDGSYAPTEGVDRAQMAKMISVIMNQGADNSALYVNSPTGLTDIATNWAKGHINYCYTLGIIAGRGNGTFDPSAGVTGVEAAKMLLVAAGYDPKIEGFEGSDWAINVNAKASALGNFRNFTKDVTAPLTVSYTHRLQEL